MNPWLSIAVAPVVFGFVVWGWGLLCAGHLREHDAAWRAMIIPFAGLFGLYLYATAATLLAPAALGGAILLPAAAGWIWQRRLAGELARDPEVRSIGAIWLALIGFALCASAMIRNYSGGDWIGDWAGHFHRAQYFLHPDQDWSWMLAKDPLAGRPPLQNLVTAALLSLSGETFAAYQIHTLLLGSLLVWPAGWILSRWPRTPAAVLPALGLVLMLNPVVLQNLTYPWTKLGTSAWVLLAVALAWRSWRDPIHQRRNVALAAGAMAAAVINHYSAAVALVVLGPVWLITLVRRAGTREFVQFTGLGLVVGLGVLATWFGWILPRTGVGGLAHSTTTGAALAAASDWTEPWIIFGENLMRTLVPHVFLPTPADIAPVANPVAAWRDTFFQLYQTNLLFGLGLVGLFLVGRALLRVRHRTTVGAVIAALITLGVWVHPTRSHWGLAHICLQPLVLGGLLVASHELPRLPPSPLRRVLLGFLFVDALLGIGLQLWIESYAVTPAMLAMEDGRPLVALFGQALTSNTGSKVAFSYQFLGDLVAPIRWLPPILAVLLLGHTTRRATRAVAAGLPDRSAS